MKLSIKGRYALRMLVYLADNKEKGYISLKEISENQKISKKYLEQIVSVLTKSGLLLANRGFQGGYKLNGKPDKITVGSVLRITEGSLSPVACIENGYAECERSDICETLFIWQGLSKVINEYLDSITLQDIIDNNRERYANNYII